MNKLTDEDDVPFVKEECGDTMWDEAMLDQLTESTTSQQLPSLLNPALPPVEQAGGAKTDQLNQDSQE
ncbi:hypothetical protein [Spirosoma foliorum]|uniref:Uncharacterized protein n=1 Tax=Spirosoma foliorum TaxID=2710596 RepID=A0A7G5GZC2_9BACT|nr:hypothetical protein [Spirosoma foliorum]QMW04214.1 hypothetical protein H3H32_04470 [Spirosoma foliorum]